MNKKIASTTARKAKSDTDAKAIEIIDACVRQLHDLGDDKIPARWTQYFLNAARKKGKPKFNDLHMRITAEYLVELARNNPALTENLDEFESIPDEEPAPRGTLQRLAQRHGMHHSSVREIIGNTLHAHRLEAQSLAIILDWDN